MTLVFYRRLQNQVLRLGTGGAKPPLQGKLVAREGDVMLTIDGVLIDGRLIKEFVLFHGEPPMLLRCDIPIETIRLSASVSGKLPPAYIDQDGSVKEGATGKVIFKA